jgi:hypothetical protein
LRLGTTLSCLRISFVGVGANGKHAQQNRVMLILHACSPVVMKYFSVTCYRKIT